jgi:methyl-accepting chemotaxis protein
MKQIRQLDTRFKILGAYALLYLLGAACVFWLLAQLGEAAVPVRTNALLCLAGGFAATGLLAGWTVREASRPLREALAVAQRVAAGDLRVRATADARGEAGALMAAMAAMAGKLAAMVGEVRAGAAGIATGTTEIASGNMDLSKRTEQQAASLEETASSMEELIATVRQNADSAHAASKLALSASEVAVKGGAVVTDVVGTMASINDSSKRIAEIIGVIDGIAFQTNILALNAAVEAARAGEQGRGFAVVASEVRSLAQRSAAAAREIKALIDDSVAKVDAGTQLVDKAGRTMDEVVTSVKRVTDIIGEIADASAEQTAGIEQVNGAIAGMDQATQQNAALVEQSAAAAAAVRERAAALARATGGFLLAGDAPAAAKAAHVAPAATVRQLPVARKPAAPARPPAAKPAAKPATAAAAVCPQTVTPIRRANTKPDMDWEEF